MTTRQLGVWGLALTLLILPLSARATTVIAPEFDSLVSQADYVVRAVVKSVNAEWQISGQNRHIVTKVELEVIEVIAGTPPSPLVLELLGGTVDGTTMLVQGSPRFYVGEEDILFIHGNGQQFIPLVALMHGQYPVLYNAKTGKNSVLRSNGMPLYSEKDVTLPMSSAGQTQTGQTSAQPLSVAEFTAKIRTSYNNARASTNAHAN